MTLVARSEQARERLRAVESMNLAELFIVSRCLIAEEYSAEDAVRGEGGNVSGLAIAVTEAPGVKCPRCWMHSTEADAETGLCPRCAAVLAAG